MGTTSVVACMALAGRGSMPAPFGNTELNKVFSDGHRISVGTMSGGGWYANTAGQLSYPPETRLLLIDAIENVSGCRVIPETLTGANHGVFAAVDCS